MQVQRTQAEAWGIKVKKAMLDKNINVKELAHALGYTRTFVSSIISGNRESTVLKERIEKYLGITS